MNALVVIDTLTPAVFSEEGGIDAMLANLEAKVRSVPTDISTPAGRAAIKSLAHQVARSKTAFDEMGKELVSDWKAKSKAVDKERARVWDRLEALQTEVREPLTDWENAEADRIRQHDAALAEISMLQIFGDDATSHDISDRLDQLASMPNRDWQEFKARAEKLRSETFAVLTVRKDKAVRLEAEQAELARLRAEQADREQKERDDRIAAEAAEKARLAAEAKAAREKQEAADKAAAETRRLETERQAAQDRAEKAERDAAAALAKAEQDKKAAAEKAESDRKTAEAKAEADRVAAIEAERKRVADAKAKADAATAKREASEKHTRKINNEVLNDLMTAGLDEDSAQMVVIALSHGSIRHAKISY